jgi:hypothetical protein
MKENVDRVSENFPVSDLAAEATNEGSPARSITEARPPRPRSGSEKPERRRNRLPAQDDKPLRDPKR